MESQLFKDVIPIVVAIVASATAIGLALFNYFVQKPKTALEIQKLEKELKTLTTNYEANSKEIATLKEQIFHDEDIIYQVSPASIGHDFRGYGNALYVEHKPVGEKATGELSYLGDVIDLERTNKSGKYELYLERYNYDNKSREYIDKDLLSDNPRKFRVLCHARTLDGERTLRVVLYQKRTHKLLDENRHKLAASEWKRLVSYLTLPTGIDAGIRFDDMDVSQAPSRLQIKNLVVTQLKS